MSQTACCKSEHLTNELTLGNAERSHDAGFWEDVAVVTFRRKILLVGGRRIREAKSEVCALEEQSNTLSKCLRVSENKVLRGRLIWFSVFSRLSVALWWIILAQLRE